MIETSTYELDVPYISINKLIRKYPVLQSNCNKKPIRNTNQITRQRLQLDYEYEYDFSSTKNQIDITEIIIKEYFNVVNYKLRKDKLCPRINNRMEYILILESMLIEPNCIVKNVQDEVSYVIDIGTGSSLVYPIIGTKLTKFKDKYIATEINESSIDHAQEIITNNEVLHNKIQLIRGNNQNIIPGIAPPINVKYLLCNPPFYTNKKELNDKELLKKTLKPNELVIDDSELIYENGGELEFIKRLIDESIQLIANATTFITFENCWFTSQVGIHSHLEQLNAYIESQGIPFKFNESIKFNTTRWIIGWRFGGLESVMIQKYISPLSHYNYDFLNKLIEKLDVHLTSIQSRYSAFQYNLISVKHNKNVYYLRTNEYVWLRKIRRLISREQGITNQDLQFDKDILIRIFIGKEWTKFDVNILSSKIDHDIHYNSLKSMISQLMS